jgi:hypothetical protein
VKSVDDMKLIIMTRLYLITVLALSACNHGMEDSTPAQEFQDYCLLSWNTRNDDFCFKIMTCAERNRFIHTWFPKRNAKCGIPELKTALAVLPKDSRVFWQDWPPTFNYPQEKVIEEMIEFAKTKDIHLEQSPAVH